MKKQLSNSCLRLNQCLFFAFPDARVWGKHSAWQSTAQNQAEARTHYTQGKSVQKPPSEREGDRDSGGRSLRDFQFARILLSRALPQSPSAPAPSRREPLVLCIFRGMGFARSVCNTNAKLKEILSHQKSLRTKRNPLAQKPLNNQNPGCSLLLRTRATERIRRIRARRRGSPPSCTRRR